jgi:putative transposase
MATFHIRRIGEEKKDGWGEDTPGAPLAVERMIAWLQRCSALLIRYGKKPTNYKGLIQLVFALLWHRRRTD